MALGDQYLTNLNCIAHEPTTEVNKLRAKILQKVATMKWKTDLHLNKTELKIGSMVDKLGDATERCLKKLKRKAPSSCKEEEVKRLKKDDRHDDQGPSHPEGEKDAAELPKTAETLNPADPTQETSKSPQISQTKEQTFLEQTQQIQTTPTSITEQTLPNPETS